jgi:hypothetical protein
MAKPGENTADIGDGVVCFKVNTLAGIAQAFRNAQ